MKKNKIIGIVSILVITIITIAIIVGIIANSKHKENFDIEKNIFNEELDKISFNGIKIGDKIQESMKNLVLDATFKYIYEDICMNVDKQDNITYLGFHENINDVNIKIEYNSKSLKTLEDFKETFGEGTKIKRNNDEYYIKYYDGNTELTILIINDTLFNVILKKK